MATPLTGEQIIERFELYTDDTTELSTDEELEVANDKLRLIYMEQPWEFLRRNEWGVLKAMERYPLRQTSTNLLKIIVMTQMYRT